MKVLHHIILVASFVGYVFCQNSNRLEFERIMRELDDLQKKYQNSNTNQNNNAELLQATFKEKCEKNGARDAQESLNRLSKDVERCVNTYVNSSAIPEELKRAKDIGEVCKKYCKIWPPVFKCFDDVFSVLRSCLDEDEKKTFDMLLDIVNEVQEFMCFKDGERIKMFYERGGMECISYRLRGIQLCTSDSLVRWIQNDEGRAGTVRSLAINSRDCEEVETLRKCIVTELEQCPDSTPANIVDQFIKIFRRHICNSGNPSGGWSLTTISALLLMSLLIHLKMY